MADKSPRAERFPFGIRVLFVTLAVIVLFTWKPWLPSDKEFRQSDQSGYAACRNFDEAEGAGGSVYRRYIGLAAEYAVEAKTPGIREVVDDRTGGRDGDAVVRDLSDMRKACKRAGYRFSG